MLAEAKSEIMRQECKVDSLNTCAFVNFNDKLILSGWDWMMQIVGEQIRLQEELALREKALRHTRIRNIHEMEALNFEKVMLQYRSSLHRYRIDKKG